MKIARPDIETSVSYLMTRVSKSNVKDWKKLSRCLGFIKKTIKEKNTLDVVNILTHWNAGWIATIDWGTATAPIYKTFQNSIKVNNWVEETRPRNLGSSGSNTGLVSFSS